LTRQGHASKIDTWILKSATETQRNYGKIRANCPEFWSRGSSGF